MRDVIKPIFFIGMPRSGTTVIFEAMTYHPELAWPSAYTSQWPRIPALEILRRLFDNRLVSIRGSIRRSGRTLLGNRYFPQPSEAYDFWNTHACPEFARSYLEDGALEASVRIKLATAVAKLARWQGKPRFAAKLTGPPRINFLSDVFPDAVFIHLVRDGRAVVQSLLKVPFWREKGGLESPFWSGAASEEILLEWEAADRDPGVLAALQWRAVVRRARNEGAPLSAGQFHEMRYEDFVAEPTKTLQRIQIASDLPVSPKVASYLARNLPRKNMNQKFLEEFSNPYLFRLSAAMEPELSSLGYR